MPIIYNAILGVNQTVNYTFSNCQTTVLGSNVIIHNVTLSALNASGLICSIVTNFPWFTTAFLISVYVILLFLFSYLNSIKLLVVANSEV